MSWLPVRLLNGLLDALEAQVVQFQQSQSDDSDPIIRRLMMNMDYFISSYAAMCMLMAVVLNRVVVLAIAPERRSTSKLVKWSIVPAVGSRIGIIALLSISAYDVLTFKQRVGDGAEWEATVWQLWLAICGSNFVEVIVSVNNGEMPFYDTGMTLFEHSLASQECSHFKSPSMELQMLMVVTLLNQISIQFNSLFKLKRFQLVPSTVFSLGLIALFIHSIYTGTLLHLPLIFIISLTPQLLILSVTLLCVFIHIFSLLLTTRSLTSDHLSPSPMANITTTLNWQWSEDFNTVLFRLANILLSTTKTKFYGRQVGIVTVSAGTYLDQMALGYNRLLKDDICPISLLPHTGLEEDHQPLKLSSGELDQSRITNSAAMNLMTGATAKNYVKLSQLFMGSMRRIFSFISRKKETGGDLEPQIVELDADDSDFEWEIDSEAEDEELEWDSEAEDTEGNHGYIGSLAQQRAIDSSQSTVAVTTAGEKSNALSELISQQDIARLLNPSSEELVQLQYLRVHLAPENGRITRSRFPNISPEVALLGLIQDRRIAPKTLKSESGEDDEEIGSPCVVCQVAPRTIMILPCRCFATCEDCRIALGGRGFKECVCCRGSVGGYCRVFVP